MMQLTYKDTTIDCDVKYNMGSLDLFNLHYIEIHRAIKILYQMVSIDKLDFKQLSGVNYSYKVKFQDGRIWEQDMIFDVSSDPKVKFIPLDFFRFSEYTPHKDIRLALVVLRNVYDVTDFTYKVL